MKKRLITLLCLTVIVSGCLEQQATKRPSSIESVQDIINYFPRTSNEISQIATEAQTDTQHVISTILKTPQEDISFETTFGVFDKAVGIITRALSLFEVLSLLNPKDALRTTAEKESITLQEFFIDLISQNKDLYNKLSAYENHTANNENLTDAQKYFIQQTLESYKRDGINLPDEKRAQVAKLAKELADLTALFDKNVTDDTSTIEVPLEGLKGLGEEFIANLKKTPEGLYSVGVDYPSYQQIMKQAEDQQTRKKMYEAYVNRAYPANIKVLDAIIAKRNELAQMVGFQSFSHLNLASEMAKTPEAVESFLEELLEKSLKKTSLEFAELTKELPPSVSLNADGTMNAWDVQFVSTWYTKKNYDLDPFKVAEYFPMEKTIEGLFSIYQQFFGLIFKELPLSGLWDNELKLLEVYKDKTLLGYLILDLYPRENKRAGAFNATIIPTLRTKEGTVKPALSLVVANFPKSTATKPSLLLRSDVSTFFHEFGHALHALFGATQLETQSGTSVKTDFVELPSQMLEEWLFDKDILSNLSSHYLTGEKLSADTIDKIITLKNLSNGSWLTIQILYAYLALKLFGPGDQKDSQKILDALQKKLDRHTFHGANDHMQAAFHHLTSYGARYYSYVWSKVFALDLFEQIKKAGLLNPEMGKKYADTILSKGGSKDPELLLIDFLGRTPNSDAFFKDLGL